MECRPDMHNPESRIKKLSNVSTCDNEKIEEKWIIIIKKTGVEFCTLDEKCPKDKNTS